MNHIKLPNLPEGKVKGILIDGRISKKITDSLMKMEITPLKTECLSEMYEAVSCHTDIMLHHIGGNRIVHAPGINSNLLDRLTSLGFQMIKGETVLSTKYPANIAYNAARVGNYIIHNLKYTDKILKKELENEGVEFIDVKQGYSKCSVCVVDKNAIITSDKGIGEAASKKGIDVLLIEPDENIVLPGLNMGFIGGCTGKIARDKMVVSGDLTKLKSFVDIVKFANSHGVKVVSLSDEKPIDVGSIIPVLESSVM
ncbi:DUF6873 family GME fold protein [Pseudobacteroides cellulosolvens]|uniref:DUF6873 domain-containing protein n=1 Tax=Pseudobacteroides cellulosolvens ATCC 35603 = DSM 2933 TaxID=398512 RepID=A0A0L6JUQ7_9FIRM|nr:hypothetical protein [Pseudobacteroides cellulosolvens]KNY29591.1 hypothetical protein Bccel_4865 [Pseudobacteroides cellulosolvens ATCC 35603 = DSM 2933]